MTRLSSVHFNLKLGKHEREFAVMASNEVAVVLILSKSINPQPVILGLVPRIHSKNSQMLTHGPYGSSHRETAFRAGYKK